MTAPRWIQVFLLTATLACAPPPPPDPPDVDKSNMEAPVAARIAAVRRAVRDDPESAATWGRLGMVFHAHALHPEAVTCYRQAMDLDRRDGGWPYLAALAERATDPAAAIVLFETAQTLEVDHAGFAVQFADTLLELGETERAAELYRRALERDPATADAHYGLARVAVAGADTEAARGHLEAAIELTPQHGQAHSLLAQVNHRRGDQAAARLAELRAKAHPRASRPADPVIDAMEAEAVNSRSHTRRGLRHVRQGRFAEAEREFRRVLEIRPGNAQDWANLGGALDRQGKSAEALEAYRQALAVDPRDPTAHNNLALALLGRGRFDEAAASLETALDIDPAYADARYNLGLLRFRQRRLEEAISHFEEALRLAPHLAAAHAELGTALAASERLEEAIEEWRWALEIDPLRLQALANLGAALARLGRHREAIDWLRRGLETAPNSSQFVSLLAWQLATAPDASLRDGKEALALAERLYAAYPQRPQTLDVLAAARAENGDFKQAVEVARRALAQARAGDSPPLVAEITARLRGYEQERPFRQSPR